MKDALFAIWFFLPAGIANVTPILVATIPGLKRWNTPLDMGLSYRGQRVLGDHKTWRGIVCGVILGVVMAYGMALLLDTQSWAQVLTDGYSVTPGRMVAIGFLLSAGALAGDAIESFFKRQMRIPSGKSWFPFDQLDYIVGGLIACLPLIQLTLSQYVWVFIVWFGMHLVFSYIGYLLHFKKDPI
jgi:CDP-2,3-bis-(O-geranylgeranyl)-sn-glycerol synthase